ncbi:MAG TPA: DUF3806 domain-containing protein [Acidimicrobiales bacterium]|nr:DUF3806 domain-containing protein [Acidimicrobiales bacterium]
MAFRRRRPKEPAPPQIEPLSISASQWRGQQVEAARRLVERYCEASEMPPSLASLDAAVSGWFDDRAEDRADVNDLVNAVGVTFGHHLAAATGLTWVLATDEHGAELALHRAAGDVLVHPANLVAERIVNGDRGFIQPLHAELAAGIQEISA